MTGAERGRILRRAAELLRARNEELARARNPRHRQADPGDDASSTSSPAPTASNTSPALAAERCRRAHRPRAAGLRLYAARAARRRRRHRRLELSAPDRLLEGGAGARLRQRHDLQAGRADAAHRRQARRDLSRGRRAGRRLQRRAGLRRHRPAADAPSGHRQGLAHRRGRHRQGGDGRRRAHAEARDARARRQVAADRLRRRRSRRCGLGRAPRQLLFRRRGLLERHPRLRPRARQGGVPRAGSPRGSARCASATRWTRRPRSAR